MTLITHTQCLCIAGNSVEQKEWLFTEGSRRLFPLSLPACALRPTPKLTREIGKFREADDTLLVDKI